MLIAELTEHEFDSVSVESIQNGFNVLIGVLDHEKHRWQIKAFDVRYFILNEMCLQNIIESANVFGGKQAPIEKDVLNEKIFYLLQGKYPAEGDIDPFKDVISKICDDVDSGKYVLFEIRPVYGAYVLVLAKDVVYTRAAV